MVKPSHIGRYEVVRRVGAGGMGVVYEAIDPRDRRQVALKVLLPHAAEEDDGLLRFKREFRALARLRHPNIVRVLDAGHEDDVPFIVMEFLDGRDIRRHLAQVPEGPLREKELRRCLRQIFGALAHIHSRRIVHRDLKPENILVCSDGRVKLMDFGVARQQLRAPTEGSGLLGTFAYMAPEQVTGADVDGRSDLYSVGVLIYEILVGDYPFPVEPPAAALHHHVNTEPDAISTHNPGADPALVELAARLMRKDPLDRLQSAEAAFHYLVKDAEANKDQTESSPGPLFVPRLSGRDREIAQLENLVRRLQSGQGGMIVVEGPSGIGKTRLVAELRHRVRRSTNLLHGQCLPDRGQTYAPFESVLDDIEEIARRAHVEVREKIVGKEAALVAAVSPRLAALAGNSPKEYFDPAERKVRLHKAIVGVIGRLSLTRPVLVIIEDLHFADASSLELIWDASRTLLAARPQGAANETVCPVGMVFTRRSVAEGPDQSEQLIHRLESRDRLRRLRLEPIDQSGVQGMLQTMTGVRSPRAEAVEALAKATHGRPMFVREMVESWVEEGILSQHHGQWLYRNLPLELSQDTSGIEESAEIVTQKPKPKAPARAEQGGLGKLSRLPDKTRALVVRLALLGKRIPGELVSSLADMSEDDFLDAIDHLVRANLLLEEVTRDQVRYGFHHEGFREAIVRSLSPQERAKTHLYIAERLEAGFIGRRAELAHVLARHYRAGQAPDRAVPYLLRMSKSAAVRGDLKSALRRMSDALAIIDLQPQTIAAATRRLQVVLRQIDLLLDFGKNREALDRADPEAAHGARDPSYMRAELALRRATCQFALGQLDEGLGTVARLLQSSPSISFQARVHSLRGRILMAKGDHEQAWTSFSIAHQKAEKADYTVLKDDLDIKLGVVMLHRGEFKRALAKLETCLATARQKGNSRAIADLLGHIGIIQAARGNSSESLNYLREALELAEARGAAKDLERWTGELGRQLSEQGEHEAAQDKLRTALELALAASSRQGEARWRGELGIHLMRVGDLENANKELTRCLGISRDIGFSLYEAWSHIYLSALTLESSFDAVEPAWEHVNTALDLAEDLEHLELKVAGRVHLAKVHCAQGEVSQAKKVLSFAARLATEADNLKLSRWARSELQSLPN